MRLTTPPCALAASFTTVLVALACAVAPLRAQRPPQARAPKVMLIGIDGVRPDVLSRVPTPNLDALIRAGAFSDRAQTGLPTISGPGWASMLTGVWKEKHGIVSNSFPFPQNGLDRYPDFLTRIERIQPALRTFAVADWAPLVQPQRGEGDVMGVPVVSDAVDSKLFFDGDGLGWAAADERSVDAAVRELTENDPAALFVYLGNPDEVSHHTGSIEDEYRASLARADRSVGRLMDAVRGRRSYAAEDWLILVATDHGRLPSGSHGGDTPEERTIFFLASGPGTRPGTLSPAPKIVDVAATALRHLGLGPRAEWQLDGVPVGLAPR
jgi:predicted AlkP superfamily pyrophosphatase or phosphodiesterase